MIFANHVPQLLVELEQSAAQSQQQISSVKQQIALKNRESRMLQLTSSEVESLPRNTNIYEGVGKMYATKPPSLSHLKDSAADQNAGSS